jgi:hypothetical protein
MPKPHVFVATAFDADIAFSAAETLCDEADRSSEWDRGTVSNALALALDAFPGFSAFVSEHEEDAYPEIDLSALPPEAKHPLLDAVAGLAQTSAKAELDEGFEWHEVEADEEACRAGLLALALPAPKG